MFKHFKKDGHDYLVNEAILDHVLLRNGNVPHASENLTPFLEMLYKENLINDSNHDEIFNNIVNLHPKVRRSLIIQGAPANLWLELHGFTTTALTDDFLINEGMSAAQTVAAARNNKPFYSGTRIIFKGKSV